MLHYNKIDLPKFDVLPALQSLIETDKVYWIQPANSLSAQQICLNAAPGYTHDVSFGAGYFADKGKSDFFIRHTDNGNERIPMKPSSVYHWEICDVFLGTVFEDIYTTIKSKYNIGRVRLLKSAPRTCMNWHVDPIPRLHYPIQTDSACLMIIEDELHHLPLNTWTLANTHKGYHTALNASDIERIHIVADILP